jgi:hypothetical protein
MAGAMTKTRKWSSKTALLFVMGLCDSGVMGRDHHPNQPGFAGHVGCRDILPMIAQ